MSTANLPAKRTPPQGGNLAEILKAASGRIAEACPEHFTPARLMQLASVLVYKTPKLQQCHPESIITAMIQVGSLGLDLNPSMMEAFLIPRWNKDAGVMEAQFQPGYQGLAKLAVNTGSVNKIVPREVCENDTFEVWQVDGVDHVKHGVNYKLPRGRETHYYAVATTTTGPVVEVMTVEQTEEIRSRSQYPDGGPWRDWPGEMRKKTVIKRLCKRLPRSADPHVSEAYQKLQQAIEADDREYESALEPPVPEHHAINHNNDTGHGSGAYADPDTVRDYQEWLRGFVLDVNTKWCDHITLRMPDAGAKSELLSTWQVSGHLCKWAGTVGLINAPEKPANRQYDQFAAVAWQRHRSGLIEEAEDYGRRKWREAWQELKTKGRTAIVPATEQRRGDVPVVAEDDPDPEFDEPGSDG